VKGAEEFDGNEESGIIFNGTEEIHSSNIYSLLSQETSLVG
jgi:hypothetical protein